MYILNSWSEKWVGDKMKKMSPWLKGQIYLPKASVEQLFYSRNISPLIYPRMTNSWKTSENLIILKTLSLREKINYLGISPKLNHRIIASQGFQIRKDFCDISFRFQDIGITLVLIFFFNSAHIWIFLVLLFYSV